MEINFKKIIIGIFIGVTVGLILFYVFGIGGGASQSINNTPNSINTIGQIGNNNINVGIIPLSLNNKQKDFLRKIFSKNLGKIGFVSKIFDSGSEKFATELSDIFISAGWEVDTQINKTLLDSFNGDVGIYADGNDLELVTRANLICDALKDIDIICGQPPTRNGVVSGNFSRDYIYMVVDSR